MLVLSRKRGERIVIGPNIELTVVDIRGNKVRLAVDAPRDVSIHRQEIYRRIQDESRHEGNAKWARVLVVDDSWRRNPGKVSHYECQAQYEGSS